MGAVQSVRSFPAGGFSAHCPNETNRRSSSSSAAEWVNLTKSADRADQVGKKLASNFGL